MNDEERKEQDQLCAIRTALTVMTWWMMDKFLNHKAPVKTAQISTVFAVFERKGEIGVGVYYQEFPGTKNGSHCTPIPWIKKILDTIRHRYHRTYANYNVIGRRELLQNAPGVDALYAALMTLRPYLPTKDDTWSWPEDEYLVIYQVEAVSRDVELIEAKSKEEAEKAFLTQYKDKLPTMWSWSVEAVPGTLQATGINHISYVPPFTLPPLA